MITYSGFSYLPTKKHKYFRNHIDCMIEDLVERLKTACDKFGGDFMESNTKAVCEIGEDIRIVLNKKEGWVKYYQEGRLRVWGLPSDLPFITFGEIFGKYMRIEFRKPHTMILLRKPKNSIFIIAPNIERTIIADEFKKEYYEKIMRLRKAR